MLCIGVKNKSTEIVSRNLAIWGRLKGVLDKIDAWETRLLPVQIIIKTKDSKKIADQMPGIK